MVHPACPVQAQKGDKVCFLPVTVESENFENAKRPLSPIQLKPAFLFQDYYESSLDNPAYFDAIKVRKEQRTATKKKKFSSVGIVPDQSSSSAKLTKVPGLNIWRLDFSKSGTDPESRRRQTSLWQRLILSVVMAGVLALLVSGIAVLVHAVKGGLIFGIPWFPFENGNDSPGVRRVAAHFRIMNRYFTPELANSSSQAHIQLATELKHSLDIVFVDSPIVNYYNTSEDFLFTNGSVVVECMILLSRPVMEGAEGVGFAFLQALEKGKGILPPGKFYVDVHTVTFAAVSKPIDESVLQDLQGLEPWSEWSSCHLEGVCDATQVRIRRRKCRESRTRLCGEDTEVVETKPCTCPVYASVSPLMLSRVWSEWNAWSACPEHEHCDRRHIQRRTRNCMNPAAGKIDHSFLCSKGIGEVGTQIRHCPCKYTGD